MKSIVYKSFTFFVSICMILTLSTLNVSALTENFDDIEFVQEMETIQDATEKVNISEDIIDAALAEMQFPVETLRKMSYVQKEKIYRSMEAIDGFDEYTYGGYIEETAVAKDFEKSSFTRGGTFSDNEIRFSAPYVHGGNNLQRYILYPTFEFLLPSTVDFDTFSYAVNSSYWKMLYDGGLEITAYWGSAFYDRFKIENPSSVQYCGCEYRLSHWKGDGLSLFYTGVGCMALRPTSSTLDMKLTVNYARDCSDWGLISIDPFGSIMATFFNKSIGKELKWGA